MGQSPSHPVRLTLLLALGFVHLILGSGEVHAQTPDTTDWRSYFPLEVGNRWQYHVINEYGEGAYGYEVVRDTVIEGRAYVAVRYCNQVRCYDAEPSDLHDLRYDDRFSYVAEWTEPVNSGPFDQWWGPVPCALDAPFDGVTECAGSASEEQFFVQGGPGYDVVIAPDTLRNVTYKLYESVGFVAEVVSGLGVISRQYPKNRPDIYEYLVYARVGGVEVGAEAFRFPTNGEAGPEIEGGPALSVWPNPARDRVTVGFERGNATQIQVTDLAGRSVLSVGVGATADGTPSATLDVGDFAPGVYVVTAESGGRRIGTRLLTVIR